ncbi:hypothetical protein QAD02_018744 [Eretmocerus hayati]|uniref:Uncharacterized protein n=1 Tax=Eretmocerus hayati TaxID=131215 RepID=A0ACC2PHL3_9HYME|nr:hypothetical protein QAD02_018744 [Eretmocerus hayati]
MNYFYESLLLNVIIQSAARKSTLKLLDHLERVASPSPKFFNTLVNFRKLINLVDEEIRDDLHDKIRIIAKVGNLEKVEQNLNGCLIAYGSLKLQYQEKIIKSQQKVIDNFNSVVEKLMIENKNNHEFMDNMAEKYKSVTKVVSNFEASLQQLQKVVEKVLIDPKLSIPIPTGLRQRSMEEVPYPKTDGSYTKSGCTIVISGMKLISATGISSIVQKRMEHASKAGPEIVMLMLRIPLERLSTILTSESFVQEFNQDKDRERREKFLKRCFESENADVLKWKKM